jgi:uncharacterized protein (TIGR02145 family)
MSKQLKLVFYFLAVLFFPALCLASVTILSNASPNHTVTSGSDEQIYGTSSSNQITLESGAKAELINFPGQNSIQIQSETDNFTVFRAGTVVTFQGTDGTRLKIPATQAVQTISFAGQTSLTLSIHNSQVMLDDQVIGIDNKSIAVNCLTMTEVSQLYVAIFNLASTGQANISWQESGADMSSTANAMLDSDFYKSYFGAGLDSDQAFIEHIYLNTLAKTVDEDPAGVAFWVRQLEGGASRGEVVASLVQVIKNYAPGGPFYNPDDAATIAAYNQFTNRVEVSNYMAKNVQNTPDNYAQATSFDQDLVVTDEAATVNEAKRLIDIMAGHADTCGAYIAPGVWKEFDCYNLAAIGKTTGDDPFTPSWRLIGGYWQWGRKGPDPSVWYDTNTPNFAHGPRGSGYSENNSDSIIEWDSEYAPDGAWSDNYKTTNDPCPSGFRVPTGVEWEGVLGNNTQFIVGTWIISGIEHILYSSAMFFGEKLMLQATGNRSLFSGGQNSRDDIGYYWSSSQRPSREAQVLTFYSGGAGMNYYSWRNGYSVRCVAE